MELDEMHTHDVHLQIKKMLQETHSGYVLVTCSTPTLDGKMQVRVSYDGPLHLAGYLAESAERYIDEENAFESDNYSEHLA